PPTTYTLSLPAALPISRPASVRPACAPGHVACLGEQHRPVELARGERGRLLVIAARLGCRCERLGVSPGAHERVAGLRLDRRRRSEEHTSELQSLRHLE